jgi:hypothetical protein
VREYAIDRSFLRELCVGSQSALELTTRNEANKRQQEREREKNMNYLVSRCYFRQNDLIALCVCSLMLCALLPLSSRDQLFSLSAQVRERTTTQ